MDCIISICDVGGEYCNNIYYYDIILYICNGLQQEESRQLIHVGQVAKQRFITTSVHKAQSCFEQIYAVG